VTSEEDFQSWLDLHPEDWQTRFVFADWLDERGDVRGPGYRAIGVNRLGPVVGKPGKNGFNSHGRWCWAEIVSGRSIRWSITRVWFSKLSCAVQLTTAQWGGYAYYDSRRDAEDDAARAFALLSDKTRAGLLKPSSVMV
jgi:uncharacterized protein (TIGR02996 family)